MSLIHLDWYDYRYFPYERRFAEMEVMRLLGVKPIEVNGSLQAQVSNPVDTTTLERFTYFRRITTSDGRIVIPQQARLEASATSRGDPNSLRRQATRYSAHGLHEYRGKFNPQIVRTVLNLIGLDHGDRILDLFCGSGTVLLEARHQGFDALGVDMNPLAVDISNAKIFAVKTPSTSLRKAAVFVIESVQKKWESLGGIENSSKKHHDSLGSRWIERHRSSEYLRRWFPISVLVQLTIILDSINEIPGLAIRNVFKVILSDITRNVSWQDPSDLRIRRRKDPSQDYPAIELFVSSVKKRINVITAARKHVLNNKSWQRAVLANSSNIKALKGRPQVFLDGGIECVISSPPYATALPYIDTQRLSLALLDLATPQEIRRLDGALVGSREVSNRDRIDLESKINTNSAKLPDEIWKVCTNLMAAYCPDIDGFRRQNTPAVVYRYFSGMAEVMATATECIRSGGHLAFVVGPNRTSLGGEKFPHRHARDASYVRRKSRVKIE